MVQFSIEKDALKDVVAILAQVSALKSPGASPSESSSLRLSPTMLSITNMNQSNGAVVENIPITVEKGDIGPYLEKGYMVNTKKLASIVKGCGGTVKFMLDQKESKLAVGESNRRFDLAFYTVESDPPLEITFLDKKVPVQDILQHFSDADMITEMASEILSLSGVFFTQNEMLASDNYSGLHVSDVHFLDSVVPEGTDVFIGTDLFSTCLSRTNEEEALLGFTPNAQRLAVKIGNVTIYKTLQTYEFPKAQIQKIIQRVENPNEKKVVIRAKIPIKDFSEKLHELREIVETDEYYITLKANTVVINAANDRRGAEGCIILNPVEVEIPAGSGITELTAKFSYAHLGLFSRLFPGQDLLDMYAAVITKNTEHTMEYLAAKSGNKLFFCSARI